MCNAPVTLPTGEQTGCRECWQCKQRKVDDWVGRCIAQSKSSHRTFSMSLTYGRDENDNVDHIRVAVLTYSDVQKYMKRLRKSGYLPRYFAVGEYGSKKGRAHWHLIVFFDDNSSLINERLLHNALIESGEKRGKPLPVPNSAVPEHEISTRVRGDLRDVRFSDAHWPHGHAVWEELHDDHGQSASRAVRYVCKYLTKDFDDPAMQMLGPRMSKKPPIGDDYFRQRAANFVKQGLAPQDLFYSFSDVRSSDGAVKRFVLNGVSAYNFIKYYVEAKTGVLMPPMPKDAGKAARLQYEVDLWDWIKLALSPRTKMPNSELVEEWLDGLAGPLSEAAKYREHVRDLVRAKYKDAAYGAGFNLYNRDGKNGEEEPE